MMVSSRAIVIIMIFSVIMFLTGCLFLPLPIGAGEILEGEEVKAEQLRVLLDPLIRKENVVDELGEPNVIWEEPRVYAYHWRISDGKLYWFIGGGYSGIGGVSQMSSGYVLLIQFDEIGKIIRLDRLPMPGFNKYGRMFRDWVSQPVPENLTSPEKLLENEGN